MVNKSNVFVAKDRDLQIARASAILLPRVGLTKRAQITCNGLVRLEIKPQKLRVGSRVYYSGS